MTKKFTKAVVALTAVGALALPASQAAAGTSKTESALLGALLGGVAGAAVGNGKTEAVAIGAIAGGALGYAVDKSNDRKTYRGYSYQRSQPYHGYHRSSGSYGHHNYGYRR